MWRINCWFLICWLTVNVILAAEPPLYDRANLVAWCIVPFDSKQRGPVERVELLRQLGFKKYAYDWRAQHLPTFDQEVTLLKKQQIELTAVWFPNTINRDAQLLLDVLSKHELKTQLWVMLAQPPEQLQQAEKVKFCAEQLASLVAGAGKHGHQVVLYNHGGWTGEPANQIAVIQQLNQPHLGMVYNLHHGHEHLAKLPELLKQSLPYLRCVNLNGMVENGDKTGEKILPLGAGKLDLQVLKQIQDSGYHGPIGIIGHTQDDVAERLQDNLAGLDWLLPQLQQKTAGPRPIYKTYPAVKK
jgi:sugar phosphate isomerase/epimerase